MVAAGVQPMIRQVIRSSVLGLLLLLSSLSVAAAPDPLDGAIENARLLNIQKLDGEVFHVQGLALGDDRIWVTSVDRGKRRGYLHEFERGTGKFLRRLDLTDGARYHVGGISISGGSIWVPVAEMKLDSSAALVEIDADSLAIRGKVYVADHVGCIAASDDYLVAGNWDARLFYVIDLKDRTHFKTIRNTSRTRYQDMKFDQGQIVAGGHLSLWSGTVNWIDWPSMKLTRTLRAGAVGPVRPFGRGGPFTGEGMAIEGRELYVIPEDGPSRVFHFRLAE